MMSIMVFCSMLDALFDVLLDVVYRRQDDKRVFAILFGTQLVVDTAVFE